MPGDYIVYIVKKGDSLWSIANQYGISINDIIDYNNLGSTFLQIGQQLLIPNVDIKDKEENNSSLDKGITYVVKKGDTLWSIAKKYNINVNNLKEVNNLSSNLLTIGDNLIIPETDMYKKYIVKSGDSLWKIAQTYNVNVNDLIKINNLSSNLLQIGQTILIP